MKTILTNHKPDEMKWVVEIRRKDGDVERHDFYNLGAARDYAKGYRNCLSTEQAQEIEVMYVYQIFDCFKPEQFKQEEY